MYSHDSQFIHPKEKLNLQGHLSGKIANGILCSVLLLKPPSSWGGVCVYVCVCVHMTLFSSTYGPMIKSFSQEKNRCGTFHDFL